MMSPAERQQALDEISRRLTDYNRPLEVFLHLELKDAFDFTSIEHLLKDVLSTVARLRSRSLEELPTDIIEAAARALDEIGPHLGAIFLFKLADIKSRSENPTEVHDRLIANFQTAVPVFIEKMTPVLAYAAAGQENSSNDVHAKAAQEQIARIAEVAKTANASMKELEGILAAAREAAGKVGVSEHAKHFAEEANQHGTDSGRWLAATVLAGVLTFVLTVLNYLKLAETDATLGQFAQVQIIVAKLLLFSVLLTTTIWCGRNYRAARHNLVVNRHRQNALSSFQTFAEATSDAQTKNAVLLQATQSIFAPQSSGYVSGEGETAPSPQIIELIRSVTGSGKL